MGGRGRKRKMKIEERGCVVHSLVCDFLGKREGDRRRGEMQLWLQESWGHTVENSCLVRVCSF